MVLLVQFYMEWNWKGTSLEEDFLPPHPKTQDSFLHHVGFHTRLWLGLEAECTYSLHLPIHSAENQVNMVLSNILLFGVPSPEIYIAQSSFFCVYGVLVGY